MKKNIVIIALVFIIPLLAFWILSSTNPSTAKADIEVPAAEEVVVSGKPQVLKFTSTMCLDCQTMNKLFKEVFPKYSNDIVLTEISVQDGKEFTNEQIKKYNITLVPTMIFLDSNNKEVRRVEGAIEKEILEEYLEGLK